MHTYTHVYHAVAVREKSKCTRTCICMRMRVRVRMVICVHIYARVTVRIRIRVHVCMFMCLCTCTPLCTCICICIRVCMFLRAYMLVGVIWDPMVFFLFFHVWPKLLLRDVVLPGWPTLCSACDGAFPSGRGFDESWLASGKFRPDSIRLSRKCFDFGQSRAELD